LKRAERAPISPPPPTGMATWNCPCPICSVARVRATSDRVICEANTNTRAIAARQTTPAISSDRVTRRRAASKARAQTLTREAEAALAGLGPAGEPLAALADFVLNRTR